MQGGQTVLWLKDGFSDRRKQMPIGERCTTYNKREQKCFQSLLHSSQFRISNELDVALFFNKNAWPSHHFSDV